MLFIMLFLLEALTTMQPARASTCIAAFAKKNSQTQTRNITKISIRAAKASNISEQELQKVKELVETTLRELSNIETPEELEVIVLPTESKQLSKAETKQNSNANRIFVTTDPSNIIHELGHVLFDQFIAASQIKMAIELAVFTKKYDSELLRYNILWDYFHGTSDGKRKFTGPPESQPDYHNFEASKDQLRRIKETFPQLAGIAISPIWLRHAELFADSMAYALTGNPTGNVDRIDEMSIQKLGPKKASDILRARDFNSKIEPQEWGNEHPYRDPHIYFGPVHWIIGQKMINLERQDRISMLPTILKALLKSMDLATANIVNGSYIHYPDIVAENKKMIALFKDEKN